MMIQMSEVSILIVCQLTSLIVCLLTSLFEWQLVHIPSCKTAIIIFKNRAY